MQLSLNLEVETSESIEYRDFTIVIAQEFTKKRNHRSKSNKDNEQVGIDTFEFPVFESRIYKSKCKYSGKLIAKDERYTKSDTILVTKAWIDLHIFGEKEKHKYYPR